MRRLPQKAVLITLILFISMISFANPSLRGTNDDPEVIEIEEVNAEQASQGGRAVFPISAYYFRSSNLVEVYFTENVGALQITIENSFTEAIDSYYVNGTQGNQCLYISGIPGTYIITLFLSSGEVYSGSWIVE